MPENIPLNIRLISERNMRINERFTARARIRKVLATGLAPMLRTAQSALGEPMYVNVARERINRALALIEAECAALDQEEANESENPDTSTRKP